MLLPLSRAVVRLDVGVGGPLLGAVLMRCLTPGWVLFRSPSLARRLAWAEEAVAVYRSLADHAGTHRHDREGLARALVVQSRLLNATGRFEEALAAADASLGVPGVRPSPTQSAYALFQRAGAYASQERFAEALAPAGDCVEMYRCAVPARRDRTLARLPAALHLYAWVLGALGRTEESVAQYEECAALLRARPLWAATRVPLLRPTVLVELIGALRDLSRYEAALALATEAREEAIGPVAWLHPQEILSLRVQLCVHLAHCQAATDRLPEARKIAEEAVGNARKATERHPKTDPRLLAMALQCLATVLHDTQEDNDELRTLQELVDLLTGLADEHPEEFDLVLANVLDDLARAQIQAGADREALVTAERSVATCRRAALHSPEQYQSTLARLLPLLSLLQGQANDSEAAVATAREGVALTRGLTASDWHTYHPLTARRLRTLARTLRHTDDHATAIACLEESESILREVLEHPGAKADRHAPELAKTLSYLAFTLRSTALAHLAAGRPSEAATALRSLLDLTQRTDGTDVHATCVTAFAEAHEAQPNAIVQAWQRQLAEPYPTFVYRISTDRT